MPHLPDHETHDPELVAAYAAGDATGPALDAAAALVASCPECGELHRDLRAIAAALPVMPAPVRTRDFRLSAQTAASLRPTGWRGFMALLAGPRFSLAAPLGAGLAALGLAGLLLGSGGLPLAGSASQAAFPAASAAAAAGGAGDGAGGGGALAPAAPSLARELAAQGAGTGAKSGEAPASGDVFAGTVPAASPVPAAANAAGPVANAAASPAADQAGTSAASAAPTVGAGAAALEAPSDGVGRDTVLVPGSEAVTAPTNVQPATPAWLVASAVAVLAGVALLLLRLAARRLAQTG